MFKINMVVIIIIIIIIIIKFDKIIKKYLKKIMIGE